LGIKGIGKFNYALLAKWKWRLGSVEGGSSRDVLESRYGDWRDMPRTMVDRKSSYWWKDLCRAYNIGNYPNWFDDRVKWEIRNGSSIKFWQDRWVEDSSLKDRFPRLYSISTTQGRTVSETGVG